MVSNFLWNLFIFVYMFVLVILTFFYLVILLLKFDFLLLREKDRDRENERESLELDGENEEDLGEDERREARRTDHTILHENTIFNKTLKKKRSVSFLYLKKKPLYFLNIYLFSGLMSFANWFGQFCLRITS